MSNKIDKILAEISAGELFDKITILEIKKTKISNKEKLINVNKELSSLNETVKKFIPDQSSISKYINDLKNINLKLWDIEDGKRAAEKNKNFDEKFIELARNVYKFNDESSLLISINFSLLDILAFLISKIVILSNNSPAEISANILFILLVILIFDYITL